MRIASDDLDRAIDELYALPLAEFTASRDALAKELRAGDKDAAAAVKALRKPTAAAWAVNQLSRHARRELDELLDLGHDMRKAQRALLAGRGAERLRELSARRRDLIDSLATAAVARLGGSGGAHRDAVVATLEAATSDANAAEDVSAGRLAKELEPPSGFGETPLLAAVPDLDEDEADDSAGEPARGEGERDEGHERARKEHEARVAELRAEVERRVDEARRRSNEAKAAERGDEDARAEVRRLEAALAAARERATEARERARDAKRALEKAERDLTAAERDLDAATGD